MASVRVYVKKKIEISRLNFDQKQMVTLGTIGLGSIKTRIGRALNPNDAPAKPLTRRYAIRKSRLRGLQKFVGPTFGGTRAITNKRDLTLTGNMLRNLRLSTVSENKVSMRWTSRLERQKAANNQRLDPFVDFSPKNVQDVAKNAGQILSNLISRLVVSKR